MAEKGPTLTLTPRRLDALEAAVEYYLEHQQADARTGYGPDVLELQVELVRLQTKGTRYCFAEITLTPHTLGVIAEGLAAARQLPDLRQKLTSRERELAALRKPAAKPARRRARKPIRRVRPAAVRTMAAAEPAAPPQEQQPLLAGVPAPALASVPAAAAADPPVRTITGAAQPAIAADQVKRRCRKVEGRV